MSKANSQSKRDAYLIKTYGISLAQFETLLSKQGFVCAVCLKSPKEGKNLCVDHDHKTGEIRGLLCNYCNRRLIGRHRDPNLLRRMSDYVAGGTGFFIPQKKKKKRKRRGKVRRN